MAAELQPGDSVMPLYLSEHKMWKGKKDGRIQKNHYERVFQPWYGTWEFTHRLVHREANNTPLFPGNVIHHLDHNHRNNVPANLGQMTKSEHMAVHANDCEWWGGVNSTQREAASHARWKRPGASKRQSATMHAENERRKKLGIRYQVKVIDNLSDYFDRYAAGESQSKLAREIGVSGHTLNRRFKESGLLQGALNHKVICVEDAGIADVYDLQIEKYENFAVGQGVFVHNTHIRNALARFNQTKGIPDDKKAEVKAKIVAAAKHHGIDVDEEEAKSDAPTLVKSFIKSYIQAQKERIEASAKSAGVTMRKDMFDVSNMAELLQRIAWLRYSALQEREYENDDSDLPEQLEENLVSLTETFLAMAEEETRELIAAAKKAGKVTIMKTDANGNVIKEEVALPAETSAALTGHIVEHAAHHEAKAAAHKAHAEHHAAHAEIHKEAHEHFKAQAEDGGEHAANHAMHAKVHKAMQDHHKAVAVHHEHMHKLHKAMAEACGKAGEALGKKAEEVAGLVKAQVEKLPKLEKAAAPAPAAPKNDGATTEFDLSKMSEFEKAAFTRIQQEYFGGPEYAKKVRDALDRAATEQLEKGVSSLAQVTAGADPAQGADGVVAIPRTGQNYGKTAGAAEGDLELSYLK